MARTPNNTPASITVSEEVFAYLMRIPKAALIDAYCQQIALNRGECDTPVPLAEVQADMEPMLALRRGE